MANPTVIGLTGGIGCGKSAVSDLFAGLGVPVIDADVVAREVVKTGRPALEEIVCRFGPETLLADGQLNRKRLRKMIFSDIQARKDLEAILHPRIRQSMREQLRQLKSLYAILSIPLLLETGQEDTVDRLLVVDCSPELQIERICSRDGTDPDQAREILQAQCSRRDRLNAADDVIDNSDSLEALEERVRSLHSKYLALNRSHRTDV